MKNDKITEPEKNALSDELLNNVVGGEYEPGELCPNCKQAVLQWGQIAATVSCPKCGWEWEVIDFLLWNNNNIKLKTPGAGGF